MIDATTPGSPGWWFQRLMKRLADRQEHYLGLQAYYDGTNGIPTAATKATQEAYRRLMRIARLNMARLVVEALRERMLPVGFRTGAASDALGDAEAWRIWQANSLDADSSIVHRSMLSKGDGYVIVGPVDTEIGAPLITPESPLQVISELDPQRRRRTLAALKVYRDDVAGTDVAYLHLPGYVVRARRSRHEVDPEFKVTPSIDGWEWVAEPEETGIAQVPVVRFGDQVDEFGVSTGEYEPHIGVLDRISYTILSRLEIATLQAFRQRAIKGAPTHDAKGVEVNYDDIFSLDPGAIWLLPATAELWESQQVDLNPIRQSVRDDIQDLAAVTRTPLFYLSPDAANGSAEGASLAREGLVFKAQDRNVETGENWEQVMSLAFQFVGDAQRAARAGMEVLWAPPERFSLTERYDAASKAQAAGVPWRTVMTDVLQFSPQQVDRMEAERAADLFSIAVATPTVEGA